YSPSALSLAPWTAPTRSPTSSRCQASKYPASNTMSASVKRSQGVSAASAPRWRACGMLPGSSITWVRSGRVRAMRSRVSSVLASTTTRRTAGWRLRRNASMFRASFFVGTTTVRSSSRIALGRCSGEDRLRGDGQLDLGRVRPAEHLVVVADEPVHDGAPVVGERLAAGGGAEPHALPVVSDEADDGVVERGVVAGGAEEAGAAVADEAAAAGGVGGDGRQPARHRLQRHVPERLRLAREEEDVGGGVGGGEGLALEVAGEDGGRQAAFEGFARGAVAHDEAVVRDALALEPLDDLGEGLQPLLPHEPAHERDHRRPEPVPRTPHRRALRRREPAGLDAARP